MEVLVFAIIAQLIYIISLHHENRVLREENENIKKTYRKMHEKFMEIANE